MIIKRPSIFIYTNSPSPHVLRELCAGIEEEGVFYEVTEMPADTLELLAWNAANDSMLGSGIGISGASIALQMRGIEKNCSIESYQTPDKDQCRKLGANSARVIKKLSFK